MPSLSIEDYHVGIICALDSEMAAVEAMLDEEHEPITKKDAQDHNAYSVGRIHHHNVVIAGLPAGVDGLAAAATVAKDMSRTFGQLRFGLLVGIGGGIPNLEAGIDIRLGDIVLSEPSGTTGGVVQYDKGKSKAGDEWERQGSLNAPPTVLLTALQRLRARHLRVDSLVPRYLTDMLQRYPKMISTGYSFPGADKDVLYPAPYHHVAGRTTCDTCEAAQTLARPTRPTADPQVHYGVIASGNQVIKDAAVRDRLRQDCVALCVEMEAAGLMNEFPCLVVRGICDYADSHKNDDWHRYAAATAAAYAKELLLYVSAEETSQEKPVQQILGIFTEYLQDSREHNRRQETQYQNDKHRDCHRTFKTSAYEENKNINPDRALGTCRWVLDHPKFQAWRDSPQNDLLWISADPGCGKSVLSKSLIDHDLRDITTTTTTSTPTTTMPHALHSVCYFFFKDNELQGSLAAALCGLLHQLFTQQPQLIRHAIPAWEKDGEKIQQEVDELWRILHSAANDPEAESIICVLDALDECREVDQRRLITLLCQVYEESANNASVHGWLKFVVTSRPYDDIQDRFQQIPSCLPRIRLRGEDENDQIHHEIDLVVSQRVAEIARDLKLMPETKERIEQKLLHMDHRTYLWLHLAIDGIRTTFRDSLRPDQESVESLPASVEGAYEQILGRVTEKQKNIVKKILLIVVGARRALTTGELSLALGVTTCVPPPESLANLTIRKDHLECHLRQWCGLFVFVNHSRVYLIHQTAKEFLLGSGGQEVMDSGRWKHCLEPVDVEVEMARICVLYLCLVEFNRTAWIVHDTSEQNEFFEYCAQHWASHLDDQAVAENENLLSKVLSLCDTKSNVFRCWFLIMWRALMPYKPGPDVLDQHVIAFLGDAIVLDRLYTRRGFEVEARDSTDRTALLWAAERGNQAVVEWLLDAGADVNALGGEYGDALQAASDGGHEKVVQILIDAGADVNAPGKEYDNALQAASDGGHEKVVQILIDAGADVNAPGGEYGNALQAASYGGHEKVVQILIDAGADVNAPGGEYGYALQAASDGGHEKVVQILIDAGADVNAPGGEYGDALQAASDGGHEKVVQILIDAGADINAPGGFYGNALQAASYGGHEKVVQILIDAGADINTPGKEYGSALQAASLGGHEKVVQILIDAGADVNTLGGGYGNALLAASLSGHEKVVQVLIDVGADVNTLGGGYGNALQVASARGHEKVVQILIDAGADVNTLGGGYGYALQAASARGHEKVVQILIDAGADVNAPGGEYGNALQAALYASHDKVVQILIDAGADVNAQGGRHGNVLQVASAGGSAASLEHV